MKSLAGTIAHEMRTPLSTINMAARSLQRAMPDLVDGHAYGDKSYLETLPKSLEITSQRANMTIALLLSNLKGAEKVDENEVFSVKTLVEEAIAEYPFSNNEENLIQLKVFCDFELRGSPHLFRHVFFNLIKNALYSIQAAGKGEITIEIRKESKGSVIIFRDTGKGMSQSDASRVFDRFFTKSTGGTGLGLGFCEAVVHRHEGTISCEASPGEWAQFTMIFP